MNRNRTWLVCLALALVTLVLYWPVQHFAFVNYDDPENVTQNVHVLAGLKPASVRWAFTNGISGMWIPLMWLSLMADAQIYGLNAGGYHLTNLFLHLAATLLFFGALRRLTGHTWRSAFVAALFAWHPFHVESVAWITERRDVLSACLWALTLWTYPRYVERQSLPRYLAVLLVYALGLMSKPMLVTLPAVLLLLDYWPLNRPRRAQLIWEKIPFLCLGALTSLATLTFESQIGSVASMEQLPLSVRAANAVVGYIRYLGKTLWPVNLTVFYPYNTALPAWQIVGAVILIVLITVVVLMLARRAPHLPVGWLWFVGTLFPVVGLFQAGSQSMTDHYSYIPIMGLFIMTAWSAPAKPVWAVVGSVILLACLPATRCQLRHWQNSETLFRHALTVNRNDWVAHQNLGETLEAKGQDAAAATEYRAALVTQPDNAEVHFNLANVLTRLGQSTEAAHHYTVALWLQSDYVKAHVNFGNLFLQTGHLDDAIRQYRAALVLQPAMAEAHNNLGLALAGKSDYAGAVRQYEAARRVWPDSATVRANLADAQRKLKLALPAQSK